VRVSGSLIYAIDGLVPVIAPRLLLNTTPTLAKTRYALNGTGTYVDMFTADNSLTQAAPADVRSGTVYADGNLTGTLAVPAAGSVALGVPVDATTGTAVLTPAAIRSELSVELGRIDAAISSRLAPSGTLATVTTLTNAPASVTPSDIWSHSARTLTSASGPTAVQIRQEMDSNSAQLSAIKLKTDNLPSDPADQSLVEAAIAGVTAPSASTVAAAVRSELSVELGRVDAAVSSRATSANIPTADITAIKAKTDSLNVDRVNNTATLSQVGNLLAQANS
jgi:hypothetical protein